MWLCSVLIKGASSFLGSRFHRSILDAIAIIHNYVEWPPHPLVARHPYKYIINLVT